MVLYLVVVAEHGLGSLGPHLRVENNLKSTIQLLSKVLNTEMENSIAILYCTTVLGKNPKTGSEDAKMIKNSCCSKN